MAIWHGDKRIGIFLGTLLTGFTIPILYYTIGDLRNFINPGHLPSNPVLAEYASILPGCDVSNSKDHINTFYVLFMVFESVVLLLTLFKAGGYRAEASKLSRTILFDSIAFYFLILLFSIINVTVPLAGVTNIFIFLHRNIHSIVTGRIILDIRKAVYETDESGTLLASSLIFGDNIAPLNSNQSED